MAMPVSQYLEQKKASRLMLLTIAVLLGAVGYVVYTRFFIREEPPRDQQQTQNSLPTYEEEQEGNQLLIDEIDTSDWKIYRNEEFGFEFKYPSFLQEVELSHDSFRIASFVYCEEEIRSETVNRCVKNGHFINIYVSEWPFNQQNLLKAFAIDEPSQSSLPFGLIRIGEKSIHIGANAEWDIEEWVAQMAFGDRTLSFRFQGDGFIKISDESSSLEGLRKVKRILLTLEL